MRNKSFLLIIIVCFCSLLFAQAANDPTPLGKYLEEDIPQRLFEIQDWEQAKKGIDYNQDIRVDRRDENFFDENENESQRKQQQQVRPANSGSGIGSFLFKALIIIGIIIAVALIIARFIGGQGLKVRGNKKINAEEINFDVEVVEEKLIESDLDRMIREAEESKQFPLALRLQYLAGVKSLALNNHIYWKKGKTNRQYSYEIVNVDLRKKFAEVTLKYERIWYGDRKINLTSYQKLKPLFNQFIQEIKKTPAKKILTAVNE